MALMGHHTALSTNVLKGKEYEKLHFCITLFHIQFITLFHMQVYRQSIYFERDCCVADCLNSLWENGIQNDLLYLIYLLNLYYCCRKTVVCNEDQLFDFSVPELVWSQSTFCTDPEVHQNCAGFTLRSSAGLAVGECSAVMSLTPCMLCVQSF